MTEVKRITLEEQPSKHGGRLGRHVEHDPRSREFPATMRMLGTRDYVLHRRHGSILDQLRVGSCTGNALTGAINSEPIYRPRHVYREPMALRLYSLATALDGFPGVWKPDDTGSSGLAVCKAGVKLGLLTRYEHAFGIGEALDVLQVRPFITGIAWLEGCDRPNDRGVVRYEGQERGGHEIVARGYFPAPEPLESLILFDNSWSKAWGLEGSFLMTVRDYGNALERDGDVTVPIR